MKQPIIAIVGGRGQMGAAFARLFRKCGCRVLIADLRTRLTPIAACRKADITLISVPISATEDVIKKIAPFAKKGSLLSDVTSIKLPIVAAFKSNAPRGVEILSMHPLFGPSLVEHLTSQVIAVCEVRPGRLGDWLMRFLTTQGAHLKKTTPKRHDETMAIIQGITHFSAIAAGMALAKLRVNLKETREFASPIYMLRLAMIGRILSQSPGLYADIEIRNPYTRAALRTYQRALQTLFKAVEKKDTLAFEKQFKKAAAFLGRFKDEAQRKTDDILRFLSSPFSDISQT